MCHRRGIISVDRVSVMALSNSTKRRLVHTDVFYSAVLSSSASPLQPSLCDAPTNTLFCVFSVYRHHPSSTPSTTSRSMIQREEIVADENNKFRIAMYGNIERREEDEMTENLCEDGMVAKIINDRRKWTVGKVSFVMLVLVSLTDVLLNLVDAQMDSLEAPDHYDALSADVIRPAFRYHVSNGERVKRKKRMGLGTAAISSVTNALSPILPFAGGLDLRREDYWTNGLFGSVTLVAEQVRNAFASQSNSPSVPLLYNHRDSSTVAQRIPKACRSVHATTLSNSEPFISLSDIAKLTLKDVSLAFRYAVESTRSDFNANKLFSSISSRVKDVLTQMSDAVSVSRGKDVLLPTTGYKLIAGDIDALHFCAAMRIFAEWRMLRQVPEGYKGYAVGMSLGQKDIVQNVGKIEKAVHDWLEHQAEALVDNGSTQLSSPTLRDLLQFEADIGVHDKLPRLKEKTAAMGLLWVRRQLHYQTALFANVIQVPNRFDTARAAISAAYEEVYNRYHGWAVQKIFTYSFQAAPDTSEVYKVMNPEKFKEVTKMAHIHNGKDALNRSSPNMHAANNFENFTRNVSREWDKFAGSIGRIFGNGRGRPLEHKRVASGHGSLDAIEMEVFVKEQMEIDAHEHIVAYLEVAQPILKDLAALFDEFNMEDPTKV